MERFILYIAGFAGLLLLTSIAFTLLNTFELEKENYIRGEKNFVIAKIVQKIYECGEKAEKKRYSFVCEKLKFESSEEIYEDDILNSLNPSRINKNSVVAENLGERGEIVISYENNKVYVKKIW